MTTIRTITRDSIPTWLVCPHSHECERFHTGECRGLGWGNCNLLPDEINIPCCNECAFVTHCVHSPDRDSLNTLICGEFTSKHCHFCGCDIFAREAIIDHVKYVLCVDCFRNRKCRQCGHLQFLPQASEEYCERCIYHCDNCGDLISRENAHNGLCASCFENIRRCESCDRILEEDEDRLCENCEFNRSKYGIKDYSYEPKDWVFYSLPGEKQFTPRFFGIELETEIILSTSSEDVMRRISEHERGESFIQCAIPSYDGSLSHGIEFKMHPMTIKYAVEYYRNNLPAIIDHVSVERSCGLHISVGRDILGENKWIRLALLWYDDRFQLKFDQIIGRSMGFYCNKKEIRNSNNELLHTSHYDAINFYDGRVEFRQFQIHNLTMEEIVNKMIFLDITIKTVRTAKSRTANICSDFILSKIQSEYDKAKL